MDALEFGRIRRRICNTYFQDCSKCPLFIDNKECHVGGRLYDTDEDISLIENVEQWAKEHQIKTKQGELLKMFPNTPIDKNGIVKACPCNFGFVFKDGEIKIATSPYEGCVGACPECRKKFWLEEIE